MGRGLMVCDCLDVMCNRHLGNISLHFNKQFGGKRLCFTLLFFRHLLFPEHFSCKPLNHLLRRSQTRMHTHKRPYKRSSGGCLFKKRFLCFYLTAASLVSQQIYSKRWRISFNMLTIGYCRWGDSAHALLFPVEHALVTCKLCKL